MFLDAFVVRSLLLPSVLELLGRRTWAFPAWLERRLPHLAIDRSPAATGEPLRHAPALEKGSGSAAAEAMLRRRDGSVADYWPARLPADVSGQTNPVRR